MYMFLDKITFWHVCPPRWQARGLWTSGTCHICVSHVQGGTQCLLAERVACCFSAFYMICVFTQICFLWVVCVLVCSLYQFIPRCSSFAVQMYADLQGLLSQDLSQTWWGVRSLQQPVCMGTWPSTDDCRALYQHVQGSHKDDSLAHPSWWVGFCHLDSKVSHHFFGGQNWWSSKRENSLSKWNW